MVQITIVGCGGLGSNTANLLVRAGITNLTLIDHDKVKKSNLNRQLYTTQDLNKPKAQQLKKYLKKINPNANITAITKKLTKQNLHLLHSDLVLDCTDNLPTRFLINDYCLNKIPWVHATSTNNIGRVFNVLPNGPCLRCLYTNKKALAKPGYTTTVALTSAIQANEAINIIKNRPTKKLIVINIPQIRLIKVKKRKGCICNG